MSAKVGAHQSTRASEGREATPRPKAERRAFPASSMLPSARAACTAAAAAPDAPSVPEPRFRVFVAECSASLGFPTSSRSSALIAPAMAKASPTERFSEGINL
jgi:hypothetical protein